MKKVLNYASMLLIGAVVTISSCTKTEDPTPDANPNAEVFETKMFATNFGSTDEAVVVGTVSTSQTVKLRINVNHSGSNNVSKIFITKSQDNGTSTNYAHGSNITNTYGTFTAGTTSSYSFDVPSGLKSFVLDVPVETRSSALSTATDVYSIWITDGAGNFDKPSKNRVLGISTITLKYSGSASSTTFTTFGGTVGNQLATEPSFIVTSGQGNVMNQTDYKNDADPENALSVDISFASLNAGGTGLGTVPFLVSPSIRESVGFSASNEPDAANTNETHFGAWSGTAFASVTAADISSISSLTATKIEISDNGTYAFVTEAGKKGLIKVGTIETSGSGKRFSFTIKVLN